MKPIGLYIHIPFCVRKCAYCDFVSYPVVEEHVAAYFDALIGKEIPNAAKWLKQKRREVSTVYIGGGTPTAVPIHYLTDLLGRCLKMLPTCAEPEVTVEANPGTVRSGDVQELLTCGATRLSIGIQSFNERTLKLLGRIHSPKDAEDCVEMVRKMGCRNINIDLIYATPTETLAELMHAIEKSISVGPEHISVYGLSIAQGTPLYRAWKSGEITPVAEEAQREMFEAIRHTLKQAGFLQYEISNWAKPGFECQHNINYWRGGEYLGLGCAASSHVDGLRSKNVEDHLEYVRLMNTEGSAVNQRETISRQQRLKEAIMLGLRMREGLGLQRLVEQEGYDLLKQRAEQIEKLQDLGLIEVSDGWLRLTDDGVPVADEVIVWLV